MNFNGSDEQGNVFLLDNAEQILSTFVKGSVLPWGDSLIWRHFFRKILEVPDTSDVSFIQEVRRSPAEFHFILGLAFCTMAAYLFSAGQNRFFPKKFADVIGTLTDSDSSSSSSDDGNAASFRPIIKSNMQAGSNAAKVDAIDASIFAIIVVCTCSMAFIGVHLLLERRNLMWSTTATKNVLNKGFHDAELLIKTIHGEVQIENEKEMTDALDTNFPTRFKHHLTVHLVNLFNANPNLKDRSDIYGISHRISEQIADNTKRLRKSLIQTVHNRKKVAMVKKSLEVERQLEAFRNFRFNIQKLAEETGFQSFVTATGPLLMVLLGLVALVCVGLLVLDLTQCTASLSAEKETPWEETGITDPSQLFKESKEIPTDYTLLAVGVFVCLGAIVVIRFLPYATIGDCYVCRAYSENNLKYLDNFFNIFWSKNTPTELKFLAKPSRVLGQSCSNYQPNRNSERQSPIDFTKRYNSYTTEDLRKKNLTFFEGLPAGTLGGVNLTNSIDFVEQYLHDKSSQLVAQYIQQTMASLKAERQAHTENSRTCSVARNILKATMDATCGGTVNKLGNVTGMIFAGIFLGTICICAGWFKKKKKKKRAKKKRVAKKKKAKPKKKKKKPPPRAPPPPPPRQPPPQPTESNSSEYIIRVTSTTPQGNSETETIVVKMPADMKPQPPPPGNKFIRIHMPPPQAPPPPMDKIINIQMPERAPRPPPPVQGKTHLEVVYPSQCQCGGTPPPPPPCPGRSVSQTNCQPRCYFANQALTPPPCMPPPCMPPPCMPCWPGVTFIPGQSEIIQIGGERPRGPAPARCPCPAPRSHSAGDSKPDPPKPKPKPRKAPRRSKKRSKRRRR